MIGQGDETLNTDIWNYFSTRNHNHVNRLQEQLQITHANGISLPQLSSQSPREETKLNNNLTLAGIYALTCIYNKVLLQLSLFTQIHCLSNIHL